MTRVRRCDGDWGPTSPSPPPPAYPFCSGQIDFAPDQKNNATHSAKLYVRVDRQWGWVAVVVVTVGTDTRM
jgi:hypothetical protein